MFQRAIMLFIFVLSITVLPLTADDGWIETEEFSYDVRSDELLEVILDIDVGEVTVESNDSSKQCLVQLSYYIDGYDAKVDYNEKSNTIKVRLDKRGWTSNWDDDNGDHVRAEIFLPKDVDMALKTKVKAGEVLLDVGGLRLQSFRLSVWAGEVSVHFDEPNPIIMEFLDINANIGELNTSQLGNARFKKARINGGIGEIEVDLTGDLPDKAMAKVDLDIGEASVILPGDRGVRASIGGTFGFLSAKNIDGDLYRRGRYYYSEDFDDAEKTFSVRITPGLGELNVECD